MEKKLRSFIRRTQIYVPGDEAMKSSIEPNKKLNLEKSSQEPIEKKKPQKDSDPEELERIKKDLENFLCLKYIYSNIELEEKIDDPIWEQKLSNWDAIKKVLKAKHVPTSFTPEYRGPLDRRPITVILPRDPNQNFYFLKAAAYCPWSLDPRSIHPNYAHDEDVMIQLAFAARHGMYFARAALWATTGDAFPLLPSNHPISTVGGQKVNENDDYYELELPEQYWGTKIVPKKIPFDPKTDVTKTLAFFNYLLTIIRTGKRPDTNTYA